MLNQPYQPMSSPNMSQAPWARPQMPQGSPQGMFQQSQPGGMPPQGMPQGMGNPNGMPPQNQVPWWMKAMMGGGQPQALPWQQQASPVGRMFMPQQNGQQQQASPVGRMFMPQRSVVGSPSGIAQRPNGMIDQMRGMGPLMQNLAGMYRQRQSERQLDPFSGFGQGPTGA